MEYIKATGLLPENLLQAVQEYAQGCLIYIPIKPGSRQDWGKSTDTKQYLNSRNRKIKDDHIAGLSVLAIAEKYNLAESTIKKIIYSK